MATDPRESLPALLERFETLMTRLPGSSEETAAVVHDMIELDEVLAMHCAVRFDAAFFGEDSAEMAGSQARLGYALAKTDALREAADTWVEAAKRFARHGDPSAGRQLINAAFAYRDVGRPDDALAAAHRALQIPEAPQVPSHKSAHLCIAYVLAQREAFEEAMEACEEGLLLPLAECAEDFAVHAELWHAVSALAEPFDAPALQGYALRAAGSLHPSGAEQAEFDSQLRAFEQATPNAPRIVPTDAKRHVVHMDEGVSIIAHPIGGLERVPQTQWAIGDALEVPPPQ